MIGDFKKEDNPFTLQFSFIPPQYISRKALTEEITNDLNRKTPTFRGHFLTGVRGCGKSVLMAEIGNTMAEEKDWIVVDIPDPTGNIIDALARGLCRLPELRALFTEAKLDISVLGITLSAQRGDLIASDAIDAVDMMLGVLKKKGKKVLVTIDEVTYNESIGSFSHALSSYARAGYEIYVIMTGLKENIRAIKNDRSLTFLYRANEHVLEPLNITAIIASYSKTLRIDRETAEEMAFLTKGYSFAFQVLGHLFWDEACVKDQVSVEELLPSMDQYLAEFSYDKIWSELSPKERDVIAAIAKTPEGKTSEVRSILKMDSSNFSVHRDRLITKGLISGDEYGKVSIMLPRFGEYAKLRRSK